MVGLFVPLRNETTRPFGIYANASRPVFDRDYDCGQFIFYFFYYFRYICMRTSVAVPTGTKADGVSGISDEENWPYYKYGRLPVRNA